LGRRAAKEKGRLAAALLTFAIGQCSDRDCGSAPLRAAAEPRIAKAHKAEHHQRPGRRLRNPRCEYAAADAESERRHIIGSRYVDGIDVAWGQSAQNQLEVGLVTAW